MAATLYDSPAWRGVFHDTDLAPLFTDTAALRANLLVMGTVALTQAKAGTVPDVSAQAIQRAAMEVQIDPAALAPVIAETGDPVAALVSQFTKEMQAPEHAKWVHFASDTQLTAATGLSLRLRQSLKIIAACSNAAETPLMGAYHPDPATRAGLSEGLSLTDAGDQCPDTALREVAEWLATQAAAQTPHTATARAIQHQIRYLNAALQTAPSEAASLINVMTLPQMVLGLGRLLN